MGLFSAQAYRFYDLDRFSDATANGELKARRSDLDSAKTPTDAAADVSVALAALEALWLGEAQANRKKDDRGASIESACRYLLLAQHAAAVPPASPRETAKADKAAEYFHFAANELRRVDLLERAAQAYFNAAAQALRSTGAAKTVDATVGASFELGIRSAGRARSMFDNLGEDEKADVAHTLRLDLQRRQRLLERRRLAHALLVVWGGLTRYGTSPSRWLITLGVALAAMATVYCVLSSAKPPADGMLLPALQLHNNLGANSLLTALFLAVVNLFAFGGYTNMTPQNWLGQIALLAQAVVSFFWLGTGVTFLTRR